MVNAAKILRDPVNWKSVIEALRGSIVMKIFIFLLKLFVKFGRRYFSGVWGGFFVCVGFFAVCVFVVVVFVCFFKHVPCLYLQERRER